MLTQAEEKILKKIGEANLITKHEIKKFLKENGGSDSVVESATKSLMEKNLITTINPIGSVCFIITQRGSKLLQDIG